MIRVSTPPGRVTTFGAVPWGPGEEDCEGPYCGLRVRNAVLDRPHPTPGRARCVDRAPTQRAPSSPSPPVPIRGDTHQCTPAPEWRVLE
jgi:hypothetical protein